MNKLTLFLVKHSQKLALTSVGLALTTSYLIQPHYEVFVRYAVVASGSGGSKEIKPSERLKLLFDEVCANFTIDANQRARLDLFMHTAVSHSVALGSVDTTVDGRGYAFIGLPQFANYVHASDIPTELTYFYTQKFPHGPYSPLGKQLLDLLILPDDMVRFMLARELVRLGARTKNGAHASLVSARSKSVITTASMLGGLYGAYQTAYLLNRKLTLPLRWSLPNRLILYTTLAVFGLFCQWPVALAFRRHVCFNVDQVTTSANPTLFVQAGRQYYDWRIRWNRFWHERALESHEKRKSNRESADQHDPVRAYQEEQERSSDQGYHMPHFNDQTHTFGSPTTPAPTTPITPSKFQYRIDPRNRSCGNEQWTADGDGLGFGLTDLLNQGLILPLMVPFLGLFAAPATSSLRLAELDHLAEHDGLV